MPKNNAIKTIYSATSDFKRAIKSIRKHFKITPILKKLLLTF
jgi:hypothetical protein